MKTQIIILGLRVALITILVWAVTPIPTLAGGVVTNCSNDAQFSSLLAGGGTVTFNCGTALIHLSSTKLLYGVNTTIDGGGKITLSGDNTRPLFFVGSGTSLTLRNIVLTNGFNNSDEGGAIINHSTLALENSTIRDSRSATHGGAISNSGTLTLKNSTIRNSTADLSGGAIVSTGPLTITGSLLEGNRAPNGGALYSIFAGAQTRIIDSVLRNNRATSTTDGWGGAILAWDGAPVTIESSDISGNIAGNGGGIYNYANSVLTLRNNTRLRNNVATFNSGGLINYGTATLTNVALSDNSAVNGGGGGLTNYGTATLTNVILSGNSANAGAGGFGNNSDTATATLTNVTLRDNAATYGGALYNWGTATLTNVTLSGNSAGENGGGIYNINGIATLTNITLSDNAAVYGGGLYNVNSTATLSNVTLSGNTASLNGGGIYRSSGSVTVKNTIVANSPSGGNCGGSITNAGFNLSSDTSCGFNQVPNVRLGPLANNGGPTLTHLPQPGSPAIDFVALGCPPPATDQRGAKRPADGDGNGSARCDAGAVEYGAVISRVYLPVVLK